MEGMREVRASFDEALSSVDSTEALGELRVRNLGKKGALTVLLKSLGKLSPEERPAAGEQLNALRDEMERTIEARGRELRARENEAREAGERIDVTLPAKGRCGGAFHPVLAVCVLIAWAVIGFACAPFIVRSSFRKESLGNLARMQSKLRSQQGL